MDVSASGTLAAMVQQTNVQQQAQASVLKTAMDMQGQAALTLIQAATATASANPPNLGQNIDVQA